MTKKIHKTRTVTTTTCTCECCMPKEDLAIKRAETEFLHKLANIGLTAEKALKRIRQLEFDLDLETIKYCETVKLSAVLAGRV